MSTAVSETRQNLTLHLTYGMKTTPAETALESVFTGVVRGMNETLGREIDASIRERARKVFFNKNVDDLRQVFHEVFSEKIFQGFTPSELEGAWDEVQRNGKVTNETYRTRINEAIKSKQKEISDSVDKYVLSKRMKSLVSDIVYAMRKEGEDVPYPGEKQ